MATDKLKAYTLVFIQAVCLIVVLATGKLFADFLPLLVIEISGIALGCWAIFVMKLRNLQASPLPKRDARLVTKGPYALIRHPMYSAVLLAVWPLIIDQYSPLRMTVGLVLTADLIAKLLYEESLLVKHFSEYREYMNRTKRLIPFVI